MGKRRVYELAKDYGMKGAEFVQVLKELGFEKVKTHMAVLDDADQMVIEVRLQAAGYRSAGAVATEGDSGPVRKKAPFKKKSLSKTREPEESEESSPIKKKLLPKSPAKSSPIQKRTAQESEPDEVDTHEPEELEAAEHEPQGREAQGREAQGREAQGREAQGREAQAREAQEREAQEREAEPRAGEPEPDETGTRDTDGAQPDVEETRAAEAPRSAERDVPADAGSAAESTPAETAARPEEPAEPRGTEARDGGTPADEIPSDDVSGRAPAEDEEAPTEAAGSVAASGIEEAARADAEVPAEEAQPVDDAVTATPESPQRAPEAGTVSERGVPERFPGERPAASSTESVEAAAGASTEPPTRVPRPLREEPVETRGEAGTTGPAPEAKAPEKAPGDEIRRLPQPERKAKILGHIELPKETIRDATRRSAPGGGRNPSSVDSNLRRAAMDKFRRVGPTGAPGQRRSPGTGAGPGRTFPGFGRRPGGGRKGPKQRKDPLAPPPGVDPEKLVQVEAPVTVKKLSEALGHKVQELLFVLLRIGVPANINSFLDKDQVELVALELSRNVEVVEERQAEDELMTALTDISDEVSEEHIDARPPIVTFMGHVDHGKTTLLDTLRHSQVTRGEAGGITQHVGAYKIDMSGRSFVVLDTPGHAAFTAMRARGAQLTDIVVLIVAADDGVKQQTEEALNHAKAAGVPIIVAINKIDKEGANSMRIRQQLSTLGLQPEDWGGKTQYVEISALTGQGIEDLVESIALEAEVLELQANPEKPAVGTVIEAKQTPAQGNVISLVVLDGTLRRGDLVLCGSGTGRVRIMHDDLGNTIDAALPGTPVEVLGLPELPSPGDKFHVVKDQRMAREAKAVADQRASHQRRMALADKSAMRSQDLKSQLAAKKIEEVRLIVKADVMGSLEPIKNSLEELTTEEVRVRILHSALGGITETDVSLADASEALIVGFNSVPDENARKMAEHSGVQVRFYNVIYELIDDCRALMEGLLSPEQREEVRGHAEIRRVFKSSKFGSIAGCFVLDGKIGRNNRARLVRDGTVVWSGRISGLRREKDDAKEVREGFECGVLLENYNDIHAQDIIEAYEIIEVKRFLGDRKEAEARR